METKLTNSAVPKARAKLPRLTLFILVLIALAGVIGFFVWQKRAALKKAKTPETFVVTEGAINSWDSDRPINTMSQRVLLSGVVRTTVSQGKNLWSYKGTDTKVALYKNTFAEWLAGLDFTGGCLSPGGCGGFDERGLINTMAQRVKPNGNTITIFTQGDYVWYFDEVTALYKWSIVDYKAEIDFTTSCTTPTGVPCCTTSMADPCRQFTAPLNTMSAYVDPINNHTITIITLENTHGNYVWCIDGTEVKNRWTFDEYKDFIDFSSCTVYPGGGACNEAEFTSPIDAMSQYAEGDKVITFIAKGTNIWQIETSY